GPGGAGSHRRGRVPARQRRARPAARRAGRRHRRAAAAVRRGRPAHPAVAAGPPAVPHAHAPAPVRPRRLRRAHAAGATGGLRPRLGRAGHPGLRRAPAPPAGRGGGAPVGGGGVNVLGHTRVALGRGLDRPAEVLGAVLPDLAPAAGVRLVRDRLDGPLAAGVRCHLDADAAFHAHPRFRAGTRALRADLTARGIPRGPARAVAHAGWELLLDGTLVGGDAERAFRDAVGRAADAADALDPADRPRWAAFVARARVAGPLAYDDPRWVAVRLGTVLARRP